MIINIYAMWLLLFYIIPIIVFEKRTVVTNEMISLADHIMLKPTFDDDKNVVSIYNSFAEFLKKNPKIKGNNIIIKILHHMCDDAKRRIKLNPNAYILDFKDSCNRFVFYIFISVHIPFIGFCLKESLGSLLIGIQVISYVFILLLKIGVDYKFSSFCKNFYTCWYDKILNFDLIIINELKPSVLSALNSDINNNLLATVKSFSDDDERRCTMLATTTQELSSKLDELIKIQTGNEGITPESIITSLDAVLERVTSLNSLLDDTNETINNSLSSIINVSNKNELDIAAINQNTDLIKELKEMMLLYKSNTLSSELTQLGKITSTLENDIGKTFTSIDDTIRKNTEKLLASYENFFAICETFNSKISENYEDDTIKSLKSFIGRR
jgi:hypothetical protein